jgi:hypothetical protein
MNKAAPDHLLKQKADLVIAQILSLKRLNRSGSPLHPTSSYFSGIIIRTTRVCARRLILVIA